MTKKNLYRIVRPDGGVTVSTEMPAGMEYILMYRLIADDKKILKNGETLTYCVDVHVEEVPNWEEIDDPTPEPNPQEANE